MKISLLLLVFSTQLFAQTTDQELASYIKLFRLKPISTPKGFNKVKFELGKKLFFDKNLSGNKDVSCATCHDPSLGTGDALPLSIGVTGKGIGTNRIADGAPVIARHAPHLYNLHNKGFMFWDGRVSYDGFEFKTPEPGLNGEEPKLKDIVAALDSALAAQALFPPTSTEEMRGINNEFADVSTNVEIWKRIMQRLLSIPAYKEQFSKAYPDQKKFNIGHMASAIAHFESFEFIVTQTPWDKYLRGDKQALSTEEKNGAIIFMTKGRCINCHSGSDFGGSSFQNIASPQVGPGLDINHNDEGRINATGFEADRYKFKVPALRNTSKSAPYFHSGAYQTLTDVINHYAIGTRSLDSYSDNWLTNFEINNYGKALYVERNPYMLFRKKENSHPLMRNHRIRLTNPEKDVLLKFISDGLSD
jgi:cytochrome c peroxidase